jgi:hypothetical protein
MAFAAEGAEGDVGAACHGFLEGGKPSHARGWHVKACLGILRG